MFRTRIVSLDEDYSIIQTVTLDDTAFSSFTTSHASNPDNSLFRLLPPPSWSANRHFDLRNNLRQDLPFQVYPRLREA